jgi:hypothetical protein
MTISETINPYAARTVLGDHDGGVRLIALKAPILGEETEPLFLRLFLKLCGLLKM